MAKSDDLSYDLSIQVLALQNKVRILEARLASYETKSGPLTAEELGARIAKRKDDGDKQPGSSQPWDF
jgi:hypothetical protein